MKVFRKSWTNAAIKHEWLNSEQRRKSELAYRNALECHDNTKTGRLRLFHIIPFDLFLPPASQLSIQENKCFVWYFNEFFAHLLPLKTIFLVLIITVLLLVKKNKCYPSGVQFLIFPLEENSIIVQQHA